MISKPTENHFDFIGHQIASGEWADYIWEGNTARSRCLVRIVGSDMLYAHFGVRQWSNGAAMCLNGDTKDEIVLDRDTLVEFIAL